MGLQTATWDRDLRNQAGAQLEESGHHIQSNWQGVWHHWARENWAGLQDLGHMPRTTQAQNWATQWESRTDPCWRWKQRGKMGLLLGLFVYLLPGVHFMLVIVFISKKATPKGINQWYFGRSLKWTNEFQRFYLSILYMSFKALSKWAVEYVISWWKKGWEVKLRHS